MNSKEFERYSTLITEYAKSNYKKCFREPDGILKHKFIVPGSCYSNQLWDWDSWLTDIALRKIADGNDIEEYEKGCVLNFLDHTKDSGYMPIFISPVSASPVIVGDNLRNIHKPCIAQHALFISENYGNVEWIRCGFDKIKSYINWYDTNCRHESGLYFWTDDSAIGVDNDPSTFYRPKNSSASIYLNSLMYKELLAIASLAKMLGLDEVYTEFIGKAESLNTAMHECLWDERDGFFYSADLNLLPVNPNEKLHSGAPRHWSTLIQRIDVWSGFMPMWAGVATPEEARRMVERYRDARTFNAPYGVRTLGKCEKMYCIVKSGNPSCWLGPIWGISNYMVFDGLVRYGFTEEARELAEKTVTLFGKDIEECGEMHEYYDPERGVGVNNPGFQNWNFLALNMIEWLNNL